MDEQTAGIVAGTSEVQKHTAIHLKAKQRGFLVAYAALGRVDLAAEAAKIERASHYRWLREHADYRAAFEQSREQVAQRLEDEAFRRAHDGVERPVTVAGERELIREYSDTLLIFLLKGAKPERYRERFSAELAAPGGGELFGTLAEAIRASRLQRQATEQS